MKERAPRNRTLKCFADEISELSKELMRLDQKTEAASLGDVIIQQDAFEAIKHLPKGFVDLLILDPPYNLSKDFNGCVFKARPKEEYAVWLDHLLTLLKPTLKPDATLYVCSDWKTSLVTAPALENQFYVRNRITWEREKGRGAKQNWKNNTEDIWFCTVSEDYHFDVEAVKLKRKVIAPYRDEEGKPKDWSGDALGKFRLTYPSNVWTDISVPFWSMRENTEHPTQKPEKLIAKLILASSREGDMVFDPFLGSGTTAVVARKLKRQFLGIEENVDYCCWARKRLQQAHQDPSIQGYADGVFWERNSSSCVQREAP